MNPLHIGAAPTDLIDLVPSMIEEIKMTIRQIYRQKASRPDIILVKALKSDMKANRKVLHVLLRKI